MKVYYSGSFYGHEKYEHPGQEVTVRKSFSWGKEKGIIPSVYLCGKGLVMDICFQVPRGKVEQLFRSWGKAEDNDQLSQEELEQIRRENPFPMDFSVTALINGEHSKREGMYTFCWNPLETGQEASDAETGRWMEYYGCDRESGWLFARISLPWATVKKPRLKSLSVMLEAEPVSYPGGHFKTQGQAAGRSIPFCHPVSGAEYTLTLWGCESGMMPEHSIAIEYPRYYQALTYEVSPALSQREFAVVDCADSDPVRPLENGTQGSKRAVAVTVIGRADGPTSIFLAGKIGVGKTEEAGERKQKVFSALHYTETRQVEWRMKFYVREKENLYLELI